MHLKLMQHFVSTVLKSKNKNKNQINQIVKDYEKIVKYARKDVSTTTRIKIYNFLNTENKNKKGTEHTSHREQNKYITQLLMSELRPNTSHINKCKWTKLFY